jgi:hypothetical protein
VSFAGSCSGRFPTAKANGWSTPSIRGTGGLENVNFSVPEIIDYRTSAKTLQAVAEFSQMTFNLLGMASPVQVQAGIITGNYFDVMGLRTLLGRRSPRGDDGPAWRLS